eukprot:6214682-Pleurochrysis_carterae.AAC.3
MHAIVAGVASKRLVLPVTGLEKSGGNGETDSGNGAAHDAANTHATPSTATASRRWILLGAD